MSSIPPIRVDPAMPRDSLRLEDGETHEVLGTICNVGIPANSDMFYEDGALRSSTTAATYGGIDRAPRLEDYVSVPVVSLATYEIIRRALDEAEARTGAIEPASIDKINPAQRFSVDMRR